MHDICVSVPLTYSLSTSLWNTKIGSSNDLYVFKQLVLQFQDGGYAFNWGLSKIHLQSSHKLMQLFGSSALKTDINYICMYIPFC